MSPHRSTGPYRSEIGPSLPPSARIDEVAGSRVVTLCAGPHRAEVLSYGAHLVGLWTPDRGGGVDNVVVSLRDAGGAVDAAAYRDRARNPHLGGMVGRYANRIAGSRFALDGVEHQLVSNESGNQLHGGPEGFDRREWSVATRVDDLAAAVVVTLVSPDGDQGYPGRVEVTVTYRLSLRGVLSIVADGVSDAPTVLNVTNHSYWNLSGTSPTAHGGESIAGHLLRVAAQRVVRVDEALLPTGDLDPVEGTPFDLRRPTRLGAAVDDRALGTTGGFDHCYVLDGDAPAAELVDPASGRRIRIRTDQPGVQVYTANHGAGPLPRHGAVCLETQALPDAPNQPRFPSAVLRPGERYRHEHLVELGTVG